MFWTRLCRVRCIYTNSKGHKFFGMTWMCPNTFTEGILIINPFDDYVIGLEAASYHESCTDHLNYVAFLAELRNERGHHSKTEPVTLNSMKTGTTSDSYVAAIFEAKSLSILDREDKNNRNGLALLGTQFHRDYK